MTFRLLASRFSLTLVLVFAFFIAQAQLHYGFKTGLNFATIKGPSELDDAGNELETYKNVTGFHIGATFSYHITDAFGIRGEALYSKKGARYTYSGQSYRYLHPTPTTSLLTKGNSNFLVEINNAYVEVPIMAYGRWKDFELSGGIYGAVQVQSIGDGSLTYSGKSVSTAGGSTNELKFNLSYNYLKDDVGESKKSTEMVIANADGTIVELPKILGAYYDYPEDKGHLFNTLDYGLVGGLTYYLSRSLHMGVRLQYGLADITNNDAQLTKARLDANNAPIYSTDTHRNFAIQASVGFGF